MRSAVPTGVVIEVLGTQVVAHHLRRPSEPHVGVMQLRGYPLVAAHQQLTEFLRLRHRTARHAFSLLQGSVETVATFMELAINLLTAPHLRAEERLDLLLLPLKPEEQRLAITGPVLTLHRRNSNKTSGGARRRRGAGPRRTGRGVRILASVADSVTLVRERAANRSERDSIGCAGRRSSHGSSGGR